MGLGCVQELVRDSGLKVGPHWLLIGQIDDSERREMEAKQGVFYACTAFPSVSVVCS